MSANLENLAVVTVFTPIPTKGNAKECLNSCMCCAESLSRVRLFTTPGTVACQAPLSLGILQARILEWVAIALLQGNLHNPGIKPRSPPLQADSLQSEPLILLISHVSKVMLKILQARLQQYMNQELPDVQPGFRKGKGTRDQSANICRIIEKAREFQKSICFSFDCVDDNKLWKILKEVGIPDHLTS